MPEPLQPGVFVNEVPTQPAPIAAASTSITAFVGFFPDGPVREPKPITSFAELGREFGGLHERSEASYAVRQFFVNGGRQALVVRAAESLTRALSVLEPGTFNLLCIPDMATLSDSEFALLVRSATRVCRDRRAFLLVDPNIADDTFESISHIDMTIGDEYNAVFAPRLQILDPLTEKQRIVTSSGTIAGVYARVDAARGVWKAPAGIESTLIGATISGPGLTNPEIDQLSQRSINALRDMPSAGSVIWGARTGANTNNEYRYVPVRRFALFIEESVHQGLQWAVFAPNGEPLWSQMRESVGAFMLDLYRDGGLPGSTPDEAFFVKCDHETTTQSDIDSGIVNLQVGFAPLHPAEFVVLNLQFRLVADS